jgi:hypothetical protein
MWSIFLQNVNQMVIMDFWKVKIEPYFKSIFEMVF